MNSKPSEFKIDAPPEFSAKIASIFAQFKEIEKKRDESSQSRDKSSVVSVQKDEPTVLRDDEFAIPRSKLQLDRRNNFSPCSSGAPRRKQQFEFRRPRNPPPKPKVPDHKLHPENWTKYSLASVDDSQMTDGANTAAAMAYLKQQERRSQGQALWDEDAQLLDLRAKVMFSRKNRKPDRLRPKFLTDPVPEVVGSQPVSAQSSRSEESTPSRPTFGPELRTLMENRAKDNRKISLSHLQDIDDGENEDSDAMRVDDENIDKLQSETIPDDGNSSQNSEGLPKLKKFKRTVRPRSETHEADAEDDIS